MKRFAFWISPTLCSSVVCNWMLCCCHCDTMLVMGPDWDNVSTKLWCCRVSALIRNITDGHRLCCGHFSSTPILLQICFSVLSFPFPDHLYLYEENGHMNSMNTDILNVVEGALFFTRSFCGLEIRLFGLKQFMIYFDHTEESWEWWLNLSKTLLLTWFKLRKRNIWCW